MDSSRFDYDRRSGATADPSAQKYSKWIRVSRIASSLRCDSTGPGRKTIFAIVAPPMPADLGCKTIRRILIFDNHPDSLRLVSSYRREDSHIHVSDPPRSTLMGVALLWILIVGLMMAMFWPLY